MRIGTKARIKQGDILEALQKKGWTQRQGAEFLGMSEAQFGELINLKWVPKVFSEELTRKLFELTNKLPEDLFPEFARQPEFLSLTKIFTRFEEVTPQMLKSGAARFLLPAPDEITDKEILKRTIDGTLLTLTIKEQEIVRRCIMEEESEEEVAKSFGIHLMRLKQIKNRALRKLRHPSRSHYLEGF